jgi:ACS family hexuronate transporter-like MFS transporter
MVIRMPQFIGSHKRWLVVLVLAAFSVINYVDRQALSVLAPTLRKELGITTEQYSYVISTFLAAYALGYAINGRLLDRIGVKLGMALALGFWSLAGMAHAAILGWLSLAAARFMLGLGQSANPPGGMKAISEWIPTRERGLCSAIFSNANSLGAVLAPPIVAALTLWLDWRWAFLITGGAGFVLLAVWLWFYDSPEKHRGLDEAERTLILEKRSATPVGKIDQPVSYREILRDRACLGLASIRFFTDPFSYFLAFWLIDYFQTVRGFSLQTVALLAWIPYLASPLFGGPLGGAIGDWLVRRGVDPRVARLRMMFAAACITPVALIAVRTDLTWLAVAMCFLMVAANSCWTVNQLTLATELVPRSQVASLVSLGGIAGSLGGILSTLLAGKFIAAIGYVPVFTGLGFLHMFAFLILRMQLRNRDSVNRSIP